MSNYRLLLCRAASGLYDILTNIGFAIIYASKYRRIVIVDTNPPHTDYFRDDFSNYFISLHDDLILDIRNHAELLNQLSAEPNALAGRISSYRAVWDRARLCHVDAASGTPFSFDYTRDYEEPLLIHHAIARFENLHTDPDDMIREQGERWRQRVANYPLLALTKMRLEDRVREEIERRLSRIGAQFNGVHIRATDYQTNYRRAIDSLREQLVGKLFVATDNRAALVSSVCHARQFQRLLDAG
jgi:hypothetical protein